MIVKNEEKVIERCLNSVKDIIDYWVIVDTGSSDQTQNIILNYLKDIPGELYQDEFVNFEHNRNRALALAKDKADYIIFMDADDQLATNNFDKQSLDKDFYFITMQSLGTISYRVSLIKNNLDCRWIGVVHEHLQCPKDATCAVLPNVVNLISIEGCRSQDKNKYKKDAILLEEALLNDPDNTRYRFYLAQSYRDAKEYNLAIENYKKRIQMGSQDDEEVFISYYQIAKLYELLNYDEDIVIGSYLKAFSYRPSRIEPLYDLVRYYKKKENYFMAYMIAALACNMRYTSDLFCVQSWMYDAIVFERSILAIHLEQFVEGKYLSEFLLQKNLPEDIRKIVEDNLEQLSKKTNFKY